jgi:hypothetical protein
VDARNRRFGRFWRCFGFPISARTRQRVGCGDRPRDEGRLISKYVRDQGKTARKHAFGGGFLTANIRRDRQEARADDLHRTSADLLLLNNLFRDPRMVLADIIVLSLVLELSRFPP